MESQVETRDSDAILHRLRAPNMTRTSYNSMNEWHQMAGQAVPTAKPVMNTLNDWTHVPTQPEGHEVEASQEEHAYFPRGPEDGYKRVYDNLTNQIAYRWPNPGSPRAREGCVGGSWRHIKEVLGHGGSRFVFVDGLVSVYDNNKFTEKLQAQLPYRPHIRRLYAPMSDVPTTPKPGGSTLSNYPVLPSVPAASMMRDPNVGRKVGLQESYPTNRRGFYAYK